MKWFKHDSEDRNRIESRLIRSRFGAEGYGIYMSLIEVVAGNINRKTIDDWGYVHPLHTIETLAEECSVEPEKLRAFLTFCNEKEIILKDKKRLYYPLIFNCLDEFSERVMSQSGVNSESIGSQSGLNRVPLHPEEKRREEKRREALPIIPLEEVSERVKKVCRELKINPTPSLIRTIDCDYEKYRASIIVKELLDWCEEHKEKPTARRFNSFFRNADKWGKLQEREKG